MLNDLNDGYAYATPVLEEDEDPFYTPKENWDSIEKEFLPPPNTYNINFCTDINLRALDTIAQKNEQIKKLTEEIETTRASAELFKEQNDALVKKNKMLIEKIKSMTK